MHGQPRSHPDRAVARLASRQHGVVSFAQLIALGLTADAIDWRVRAGRLHRVHRGVFAVGHARLTQRGRWRAAVLAAGDGAALSHRSAAVLWQILPPRGAIHVTAPRRLHKRDGIVRHCSELQSDEITSTDGIQTTTVARTLLDIAAAEPDHLGRAYNEAEYRRLTDYTGLAALVERYPRRRGAAKIRKVIGEQFMGATRAELEQSFSTLIDDAGLPRPLLNHDLELEPGRWIRPDCTWPRARLIVELDGRAAHGTASRFDSDRERDRLLVLAGWTVIRVTWRHVTADAPRLTAHLRKLLEATR